MTYANTTSRVVYDRRLRSHVIVVVLDPEEAENIAQALGWNDAGGRELLELAAAARRHDENDY